MTWEVISSMSKAKVGLVVVASRSESGGERAEDLLRNAKQELEQTGVDVAAFAKTVWDPADALEAIRELNAAEPDVVAIIHASWVLDSLQYLFVTGMSCPMVFWSVPYTETFSLGCVQHFGSILTEHRIPCLHVYGLPGHGAAVDKVCKHARVGKALKALRTAKIALVGPRQTWRVAGSQDMTSEEWEFTRSFGTTIVHIEMEEVVEIIGRKTDSEARSAIAQKRSAGMLGKSAVEESRLVYSAKAYLAAKDIMARYGLTAAAAECYPAFSGMMNLASSWLADEGVVLDTEGDIGHTALTIVLNELRPGPVSLSEIGSIDFDTDSLCLAHEGSSAHSLAGDVNKVQIGPGGDNGTIVGFPLKPMRDVTVASICGRAGSYRILVASGSTLPVSHDEWIEAGSKLVARLKFNGPADEAVEKMLENGVDHHLLVKEGNVAAELANLCRLTGVRVVSL